MNFRVGGLTRQPIQIGFSLDARVGIQNTIMLPTQGSWAHRVIAHRGSLFVTELKTLTLARINGAVVVGWPVSETWDQYADFGLWLKANIITYNNAI